MDYKKEIEKLLRGTAREGIEDLLVYMESSGFYTAPASTKYHLSKPGGLAEHSLNVCEMALKMAAAIDPDFFNENYDSIVIAALLHDLGKAGQFGKALYVDNVLKTGISKAQPYKSNPDYIPLDHEVISAIEASKYIYLTEEEQRAIVWHNGLYANYKYQIPGKETKLYFIIHSADLWVSRFTETGGENED
jgi:23S rRNA maturation-related 3'-5' exoribonuclease YhaM